MQLDQSARVFVFDPCFGNMTGHWENYCKRFCNELTERGYEVLVFGQAQFKLHIIQGVNFEPIFSASPYGSVANLLDLQHTADDYLDDFKKIDEDRFRDGDIFMFHSIFPQSFAAMMDWSTELVCKKKIKMTFCFQFPPSDVKSKLPWAKRVAYVARRLLHGEKPTGRAMAWVDNNFVRFYQQKIPALREVHDKSHILMANTHALSDNFSGLFGMMVHYLPMPGEKIAASERKRFATRQHDRIRIGYFGHSALEKGGQFLRTIVDETLKKFPQVEFVLHINPNKDTEPYLKHFKQTTYSNVQCFHGHLEQQQMMDLMKDVDIVLMPYSPSKYATTPSAIFTEGLPLKKVFVVPKKTWIQQEARKYDAGVAEFDTYDEFSIVSATFTAIERFDELFKKSQQAGEKFYQENNMTNYVDIFESLLKKTHNNLLTESNGCL